MKRQFVAVLAVLTLFAALPAAQTSRLLDKDTFFDMEGVSNPAISPDGKQIVFASRVGRRSQGPVAQQPLDHRRRRHARPGADAGSWRDSAPSWAPDSKRIAFLSDRDGTNQINVLWVDTGEVAQLTHVTRAASGLQLVARWQADRLHADDPRRGSDPPGGAAEAAARRRMGEAPRCSSIV